MRLCATAGNWAIVLSWYAQCMPLRMLQVEAGSDARYLSDLIRRMTGAPAYLDSTDLVDLRTLFKHGVHKSDVLVILATKGVFTRPWRATS